MTKAAPQGEAATAQALAALSRLMQLGRRCREAESATQLGFIAVNETRDLVPYRQAVLWLDGGGVAALSGVVAAEANSPYVLWLHRLMRRLASAEFLSSTTPRAVSAAELPPELAEEWAEWLPAQALCLPFAAKGQAGVLLLARDEVWSDEESAWLAEWCATWAAAWALAHAEPGRSLGRRLRTTWQALHAWRPNRAGWRALWATAGGRWLLATLLITLFPVRLSVLAPGQLVPANPAVLRSPLDGIVDRILVQPNQSVAAGQPLVEFDRISLTSRLEVASQALATAEAEYRQFAQQAVTDAKSKGQMANLQGRIAEKRAELTYLDALNQRAVLVAPRAGIALLDEPTEWVGRPVATGERILVVADEHDAEIEAWLAPGDVIELPGAAQAVIYLNTQPFSPVTGTVRYLAHEALPQADGSYAYRLRARLAADQKAPRVGLKGSVKVYGDHVPLIYWVLRKPIAAARGLVGW